MNGSEVVSVKNKLDSLFFTREFIHVGYLVPERHK